LPGTKTVPWCFTNKRNIAASNWLSMKKLILTILAAGALASAQAQLFNPGSTSGALWGGLIGGAIAGRHHLGEGIAIGAGSGFLLGALAHEDAVNRSYDSGGYYGGYYPSYSYYPSFSYYGSRGYYGRRHGYGWRGGYGFSVGWSPGYNYAPAPAYYAPTYYAAAPAPVAAAPPPPAAQTQPPPQPAPANNSISPMSSANSLFGR
jgi:hypothetical protein